MQSSDLDSKTIMNYEEGKLSSFAAEFHHNAIYTVGNLCVIKTHFTVTSDISANHGLIFIPYAPNDWVMGLFHSTTDNYPVFCYGSTFVFSSYLNIAKNTELYGELTYFKE